MTRLGGDMLGLYDSDGILRFTGLDREACLAYASLFGLPLASCSLADIPIPVHLPVRSRRRHQGEECSN
jgi:uncharacterized membrane protein YraQ (UPF0718 family)